MFDQIKKFFTKTFVSEIPEKEEVPTISEEVSITKPTTPEIFESSYIEPSSEPVIKRTKRGLKYRL